MSHGYCKGKSIPYFQIRDRAFIDFEKMFYIVGENGRRKKVVTKETLELLVGSALALAVFYQDDGEYGLYSNQAIINTCDFTVEENVRIARRFEELLKAPVRVKIKRKKYPRLALSNKATDEFIKIIRPFIHPTMQYKIDQDITHHLDPWLVEKLKSEYGKRPIEYIIADTGLTKNEIYVIAFRLGLTRKNNRSQEGEAGESICARDYLCNCVFIKQFEPEQRFARYSNLLIKIMWKLYVIAPSFRQNTKI